MMEAYVTTMECDGVRALAYKILYNPVIYFKNFILIFSFRIVERTGIRSRLKKNIISVN